MLKSCKIANGMAGVNASKIWYRRMNASITSYHIQEMYNWLLFGIIEIDKSVNGIVNQNQYFE